MKLNLGCGNLPMVGEDWVNIDMAPGPHVDRVADILHLDYPPESIDEIMLRHVIEHIHPDDWPGALIEWTAMLKVGGKIVIECPDFVKVAAGIVHDIGGLRYTWWRKVTYGPDRRPGQAHLNGFDIPILVGELRAAGYRVTRAREWGDGSDPDNPTFTACGLSAYNIRVEAVKL